MIRIALVDDHRLFLEGIRSILDREIGLEVHASVGQGVELLNLLKTTRADGRTFPDPSNLPFLP